MRSSILAMSLMAAFLAAAGSSAAESDYYRILPGDTIKIVVAERPDLSMTVRVPMEGRVMFPVTGTIHVAGRGAEDLAEDIAQRLQSEARLIDAKVAVSVAEYGRRSAYVGGAVHSPRALELPTEIPLTLMQAVISCGGFMSEADRESVRVTRRRKGEKPEVMTVNLEPISEGLTPELDMLLEGGDSVFIPLREPVYVLGQVEKAGAYPVPYGYPFTVSKAVAVAGGFTKFARFTRVRVTRRAGDKTEQFVVNLGSVLDGNLGDDVVLRPGDTVYVPERIF